MRIAVYTDSESRLVPYREADKITVYEEMGSWSSVGEVKLEKPSRTPSAGMSQTIRLNAERAAAELDGCGIIAGAELSGIPYHVFDRRDFKIYQVSVMDGYVMDAIAFETSAPQPDAEKARKASPELLPVRDFPTETAAPGVYFYNLAAAQKRNPAITSKKVLGRFINEIAFETLTLVCTHVPPWLENGAFKIDTAQNSDGTLTARIQPRRAVCAG